MDNHQTTTQYLYRHGLAILGLVVVAGFGFTACSDLNMDGGEGVGQINFHLSDSSDPEELAAGEQAFSEGEGSPTLDGNHQSGNTGNPNAGNRVSGLEAVIIDIQQIRIHYSASVIDTVGADSVVVEEGPGKKWIDVPIEPVKIDLLDITGTMELLAEAELPEGFYSEVRLILGDESEVVVNGETHDLFVPSGEQSGYKVKLNRSLHSGEVLDVTIEFDAAKAVRVTGNNRYMLHPVLRIFTGHNSTS